MLSSQYWPTIGGVGSHVYYISKALQKKGHKVIVINPLLETHDQEVVKESVEGVDIYRIFLGEDILHKLQRSLKNVKEGSLLYAIGFLRKLQFILYINKLHKIVGRILRVEGIEIVHQHDFSSSIILTKKLAKEYPIVLTNHTGEFLKIRSNQALSWLLKPLLRHFSGIIGPSRDLCDIPYEQLQSKVHYIPNGVDVKQFRGVDDQEKKELRERYGFPVEALIVLCPRRWAPTKGVKYFAEAIGLIEAKYQGDNVYCFAGSSYDDYYGYSSEIKTILRGYTFQSRIRLVGDISPQRIHHYYQLSDIIVIPSLMEATSLSALEAMASGKAVIATDIGGLPEIIDNEVNGILVEPQSSKELADAILQLAEDKMLRRNLGEKGLEKVTREFTWDSIAERTQLVYDSINTGNKKH